MSSQPTATPGPIPVEEPPEPKKAAATKKPRKRHTKPKASAKPAKTLPNWRVSVAKQFDILRAYAAGSNKGTKPVTLQEASEIAGLAPTTVVSAVPFLTSIGLLKRTESGAFLPSTEAVSYLGAHEWDPKTAAHKVGPKLRDAWFGEALLPRLSYGQGMEEKNAVNHLAEVAGASPDYEKELRMVLEFMLLGGIIQRDGTQVKQVKPAGPVDGVAPQPRVEEVSIVEPETMTPKSNRMSTSYLSQSPGGGVDFNITVHVDMAEFGNWKPERIQAFFRGIAEVLAAKADMEKGGVGS